ncbi:unnamed protein product [Agarophyton chilense]|eukprot:gb/GEZJ01002489.1/.p1 GENE.gb/GEZJ01002489.1/~~gb/GEZJ01002489.1/.p1  ORF type:complete len:550 (-),score=66.43 gb/GEZJ01002489.1/:1229-2878(-)
MATISPAFTDSLSLSPAGKRYNSIVPRSAARLLSPQIARNPRRCRTRAEAAAPVTKPAPPQTQNTSSPKSAPVENVVIIGSGPAGYTAAIYAARANLRPLVLEGMASGVPGGQLMTTSDVENFPGFPKGISGPQLMSHMREQAARWGSQLLTDDAVAADLDTYPFRITTRESGVVRTNAVIVATGASAKRLAIPGEQTLWGSGISACAICDGAAPIFSGQHLAVVGGGDSACEEAVYLCKYASHVHLFVRSSQLRASKTLCDRVLNHPSVTVHFNTIVLSAQPDATALQNGKGSPLHSVLVRKGDGSEHSVAVRGLFYAIGHRPNTHFLRGNSRLRFDGAGYLVTTAGSPETGLEGVFAAGDVADSQWRQAVTAAGSGCMAALAAERYLTHRGLAVEYRRDEQQSPAAAAVEERESAQELESDRRGADDESNYDIQNTWHSGQYALRKLYHESKRPLIVKYVSPGCGPCKQLKPMLNAVVRAYEGHVHYVEIDITKDVEIAEAAGVSGSPTVHIFHEKSLIKEFRGVKMKSEYRRVVEKLLDGRKVAVM